MKALVVVVSSVIPIVLAFVLTLISGCALPRVIPTDPDAGQVDAGSCSELHGDCDPCRERCHELAQDNLTDRASCMEMCP
jgi:hypothetical protein